MSSLGNTTFSLENLKEKAKNWWETCPLFTT